MYDARRVAAQTPTITNNQSTNDFDINEITLKIRRLASDPTEIDFSQVTKEYQVPVIKAEISKIQDFASQREIQNGARKLYKPIVLSPEESLKQH